MFLLSLDASTKSTGYAVYNEEKLIEYGLIKSSLKNPYDRIEEVYLKCKDIFLKYNISYVFIEDVPLASSINKKVAENLLLLQGTIYSLCIEFDSGFLQMEPQKWRSLACVKPEKNIRELQKKAAIELVNNLHGFNYKWVDKEYDSKNGNSDICEAILIGVAGYKFLKGNVV